MKIIKSFPIDVKQGGCMLSIFVAIAMIFFGCYTLPKAKQQIGRAYKWFPAMVADTTRDWFPCIVTELDSTAFLASVEDAQRTLRFYDSVVSAGERQSETLEQLIDRMKLDSASECDSMNEVLYRQCADVSRQNDLLRKTVYDLRNTKVAPVIQKIRDDAAVYSARDSANRGWQSASQWEQRYVAQKEIADRWAARTRWAVIVPWWVFLIAAGGIFAMFKFKLLKL